ncbi:MAG: anti-sigma factor [Phycisphaerae bacterium]
MDKPPDNKDPQFEISQYLDGQLEGRQLADFERRLAEDPALASELARWRALDERLAAMSGAGLENVDFQTQRASIMSALERKALLADQRRRVLVFRPAFWGAVAAAAAILLAVFVGMKVWQPSAGPGPIVGPAPTPEVSTPVVLSVMQPDSPLARGEEVVQLAAQRTGPELSPEVLPAPGPLPLNTVYVSCSPPVENEQEQADMTVSPFMLFEL